MHKTARFATVLTAAAGILLVGVVVAQALPTTGGNTNSGPASAASAAPNVAAAAATTTNTNPTAAFVPSPQNRVFVPITPCRIVDTRAAGGPIAAGGTRSFHVRGSAGFSGQGGAASGCGIPSTASAVAASVSVTEPTGAGWLRAWPYGQTPPNATLLNYQRGASMTTGATLTLGSGAYDITVGLFARPGQVIIDLTGYYEAQTHLIILASGQVWYGNSTHVTSLIHSAGTGTYTLTFDRSLTGCNVMAVDNGDQTVRAAANWGGTAMTVTTYQLSGSTLTQGDQSFQIFVAC